MRVSVVRLLVLLLACSGGCSLSHNPDLPSMRGDGDSPIGDGDGPLGDGDGDGDGDGGPTGSGGSAGPGGAPPTTMIDAPGGSMLGGSSGAGPEHN